MSKYRVIIFDLFGTVALLAPEKLPLFEWNGLTIRSTTGALRTIYEREVREIPFPDFVTALTAVAREQLEERTRLLREVSCLDRFTRSLSRAGLVSSPAVRNLAEKLSLMHNSVLAAAAEIPSEHINFLHRLSARYPLALISNFDHAPTARQLLHAGKVAEFFRQIVISDEHGWRKPHPRIFEDTLKALKVEPEDALFVGDSPVDDVAGAKRIGMDVAWINPGGDDLPEGILLPDYTVPAIPALQTVLLD